MKLRTSSSKPNIRTKSKPELRDMGSSLESLKVRRERYGFNNIRTGQRDCQGLEGRSQILLR